MADLIYKYTDLASAIEMISDNSVKLEFPRNYNDPFDAQIEFDSKSEAKARDIMKEYLMLKYINDSLATNKIKNVRNIRLWIAIASLLIRISFLNAQMTGKYSSDFITITLAKFVFKKAGLIQEFDKQFDLVLSGLKGVRDKTLVSCFSQRKDSLLMWSHYANCHKGVCIEYDKPNDFINVKYKNNSATFALVYATRRAIANDIIGTHVPETTEDLKILMKPFCVKSNKWRYESEVRCLFNVNDSANVYEKKIGEGDSSKTILVYHMPNNIKKIYLGCKIDKDTEEFKRLETIAKEKRIQLVEMQIDKMKYKVYCS